VKWSLLLAESIFKVSKILCVYRFCNSFEFSSTVSSLIHFLK